MIFQFIQPSLHLRGYIREYLLFHFKVSSGNVVPVKPYHAAPEEGMIFYIKGFLLCTQTEGGITEKRAQAVIFGPSITRQDYQLSNEYLMFFVRFQPGILHRLLRIPMTEFVQKNIDAEAIFGKEIRLLNEQLVSALSYEVIIRLVEGFLWKKFQQLPTNVHPLFMVPKVILENSAAFHLDKMASLACLSASQFERKFLQQIGVTPKLFARLCRFNRTYELKERNPISDWLSIAVQMGYNDYQHLVKDFKAFAGGTPNSLVKENTQAPERWLNLSAYSTIWGE
jgi:AraC-like DNA-binding protein